MALDLPQPTTLTFERFWQWLKRHRNCILRAGSGDALLYDHDDAHWQFAEDDEHNPIVQLAIAKNVIGEIVIVTGEPLFVHANPDPSEDQPDRTQFEIVSSRAPDDGLISHFLLAHGFDETVPHAGMQH